MIQLSKSVAENVGSFKIYGWYTQGVRGFESNVISRSVAWLFDTGYEQKSIEPLPALVCSEKRWESML